MMFREIMDEFAAKIGLKERIEIDEDGFCSFGVDGATVAIQGMDELELLSLSAAVGAPPPERLEQLYLKLLEANYNFRGTDGATLSVDPQTGVVHLCQYAPYAALDADRTVALVSKFIDMLLDWRTRVADFRAEEQKEKSETGRKDVMTLAAAEGFMQV